MNTAINWGGSVSEMVKEVGIPLALGILAITGSILVAALSFALSRWADATARRREGYGAAKRTLVRYREYCWRIADARLTSPPNFGDWLI